MLSLIRSTQPFTALRAAFPISVSSQELALLKSMSSKRTLMPVDDSSPSSFSAAMISPVLIFTSLISTTARALRLETFPPKRETPPPTLLSFTPNSETLPMTNSSAPRILPILAAVSGVTMEELLNSCSCAIFSISCRSRTRKEPDFTNAVTSMSATPSPILFHPVPLLSSNRATATRFLSCD